VGGGVAHAPPIEPAYFATGSYALRPFVREHLKQAVIVMRRQPSLEVLLRGHTDRRGTEQNNIGLSRQRAEAVAEFLVEQGVDRRRVQTEGVGASQPASLGDTRDDWAKNRRVELIWR
jgi:outer membrane protein OmpA-like peptidoglycan-associated protein